MPNDLITEKLVLPWPYNQNAVESRILRHSSNPSSNPVCDGETLAGLVEFLHGAPRPPQALDGSLDGSLERPQSAVVSVVPGPHLGNDEHFGPKFYQSAGYCRQKYNGKMLGKIRLHVIVNCSACGMTLHAAEF